MTTTGQIIRWSTAGAVVGVAAVAAVASYEHAYALVRAHGETGWATAAGRDQAAIAAWRQEAWPVLKGRRRTWGLAVLRG